MPTTTPRQARSQQTAVTIGVYLIGQIATVAALAALSHIRGFSLLNRLASWDGRHFTRIAQFGYTWSTLPDNAASPAFLPGYPAIIATLNRTAAIPAVPAAIAISIISGTIFSCALPHLVRLVPRTTRRTELITVALVAISPMSIVFSMAYTEALFCALAAWALVFALQNRWAVAGALGLVAGTIRISALALGAAFATIAVTTYVQNRGKPRTALAAASPPAIAAAVTVTGTLSWMLYSGLRMGSPTAWFTAQDAGWGSHFDAGVSTVRYLYRMATTAPNVLEVTTAAIAILAVALVSSIIHQRQPLLLIAYSAFAVTEALGSTGIMNSKIRLLIPAFMLLVPIATHLSRLPPRALTFSIGAIAIAGPWFSAYALTIWRYAI